MARAYKDHTVLPANVYLRIEWAIPAFAFPAKAGLYLPTHNYLADSTPVGRD